MARSRSGSEVVYVERGGDASAKWLFWGALLGAGLALLYAPRSGEETRRLVQRRLWKLRAMTEEKLDEFSQQLGGRSRADFSEPADDDGGRPRAGELWQRPGPQQRGKRPPGYRAPAGGSALAPPRRVRGRRGAARLSGASPRAWYRSPWGFVSRILQAADENNIPFLASALTFDALLAAVPFVLLLLIGLTHLAQALQGGVDLGNTDPDAPVPPLSPRARWIRRGRIPSICSKGC